MFLFCRIVSSDVIEQLINTFIVIGKDNKEELWTETCWTSIFNWQDISIPLYLSVKGNRKNLLSSPSCIVIKHRCACKALFSLIYSHRLGRIAGMTILLSTVPGVFKHQLRACFSLWFVWPYSITHNFIELGGNKILPCDEAISNPLLIRWRILNYSNQWRVCRAVQSRRRFWEVNSAAKFIIDIRFSFSSNYCVGDWGVIVFFFWRPTFHFEMTLFFDTTGKLIWKIKFDKTLSLTYDKTSVTAGKSWYIN